jgi:hypothetical protein
MLLPGSKLTFRNTKAEHKDQSQSSLKFLFHVRRVPSSGSGSPETPVSPNGRTVPESIFRGFIRLYGIIQPRVATRLS